MALRGVRTTCAGALIVALASACVPPAPGPAAPSAPATTASPAPVRPTPANTAAASECAEPCRARPRTVGRFRTRLAPEASGIAAGARNPDVLYVVDDGPGTTSLLVVRARDGRAVGRLRIAGLHGVDTEDLAVGPCGAGARASCIYIGDIGDNVGGRDAVTVTSVAEPDLSSGVPAEPLESTSASLRYPDGPHDAEALLVGPDASLVVITKDPGRNGRGAGRVYDADSFGDVTLRRGRRVRLSAPMLPLATAVVGNVVTAADAADGRVVVRTYDAIYEFTAPRPDQPLRRFPAWEVRQVAAPAEAQGEAVAYAADGCGLFTLGEGSGQLTSIPCR